MPAPELPTSLSLPHGGQVLRLERAGEGASSWVFRGELDGRTVGVKLARDASFRLEREAIARAVAGVGAPIDAVVVEGKQALVYEWIAGDKLADAPVDASRVAHDIAVILARLHLLGMRHGDVKADNVVVRDGRASLIDFGLAAPFGEPLVGGTPATLPPEVLASGDGALRIGPEADVYALGLVLRDLGGRQEPLARLSLSSSPGERPSAAMLAGWESHVPVDAAYVLARLGEIERGARDGRSPPNGVARAYVEGLMRALAALSGARAEGAPLGPLDDDARRRLLVRVLGRAGEGLRIARVDDDALLAALASPALIARDLLPPGDAESLAAALARLAAEPGDEAAIVSLAAVDPASMNLDAARVVLTVLRRAGRFDAAKRIAEAHRGLAVDACELARSAGDRVEAEHLAAAFEAPSARGTAAKARLAIDRGALDEAAELLANADLDPYVAEARALLAWRRGDIEAGLSLLDAVDTQEPELLARSTLVRGLLLHARGDAAGALRQFVRAADVALAIAAIPLEATARAGAAAAAHDAGRYGDALDAASRAIALLARFGRHADVARARLNRAATLVALGANAEALAEGARAQVDAARANDVAAVAYALFVQSEATLGTPESLEFARSGRERLGGSTPADTLLGLAYEALAGGTVDPRGDAIAQTVGDDGSLARWTWWRASLSRGQAGPLDALVRAADSEAPPELVGATLAAGVEVARRAGRGDVARALSERIARLAARLTEDVPAGRRATFAALPWVRASSEGRADELGLGAGQIDLLASIARGLRDRTSLGDLLRQVLDGLVLWVGVERGLLLLRTPDGTGLVPRVARGLSREDLRGDQLALSTSLAQRALSTLEPVVAVDAGAGDAVTASIHALRLRSVLAVPLVARGEALGVVYLDDRVRRGAFGPREVAWVRLLATQAAAAIADARDTLRLRRLARRAERAQRRLEDHLSMAEGELEVARAQLAQRGSTGKGDPRGTKHRYDAILGDGEAVRKMLALVDRVTDASDARIPVLVVGESGTGKELVARAIHANGPRKSAAFVAENCGAIPEPLLESTLFGHVRGAFTGADRARVGLFDIANGGTLLLDEIGEMSLAMQAKLLRVLQEGEVRPVGGERSTRVDVRVIGATHRDLESMVRDGKFREDLFYRLAVVTVRVPPLRERTEDLPVLVHAFLDRFAGRPVKITKAALGALATCAWPGNVRQLENEIRRALVLCESVLDVEHLSPELLSPRRESDATSLRGQVDALERRLVTEALRRAGGNQTHAAKSLGVSRFGLQKMLKRLGLAAKST